MKQPKHTVSEYQVISADVWALFKKYFTPEADWNAYMDDIDVLVKKYNSNPRLYEFFNKLLRVYAVELEEMYKDATRG